MSLRDLDIDIDVDIDSKEIIQANEYAEELVDTLRELDDLIKIRIGLADGDTAAELRELQQLTRDLDGERIRISADIEDVTSDIAAIHTQLERIDHHSINIDVDTTAAHAQLAALQAHTRLLGSNKKMGSGLGGLVPSLMGSFSLGGFIKLTVIVTSLMILLPALASMLQVLVGVLGVLGVAIGVVAGGLLSFVSAVGIAAIGLGGFAVLGISAIAALYDENAELTKEQKELKKQTDTVVKSWKDLSKALQPLTFSAITSGVASVNTLLDRSEPILKNATSAVDGLFASFNKSLDSSAMQSFFSYLERSVGPLTSNIGNGLGYALQGVLNTMTALEPLTNWVAQGFENSMGRFAKWTEGLKGSDELEAFINSAKTNLQSIGGILKNGAKGLGEFFGAFDMTATEGLDWLEQKMKDFATWASNLDENEGFQEFLNTIKIDGPVIAGIIGNIATNIGSLSRALSSLGRDENGNSNILGWFQKLTDPANFNFEGIAENFSLSGIFKGGFSLIKDGFNWSEIFSKFNPFANVDFSGIYNKVQEFDWARFISPLNWPSAIGNFMWDKFISKLDWSKLEEFSWSKFLDKFIWPNLPNFSWSNFISKFLWPVLPTFSWSNFISKFNWSSVTSALGSKLGLPGFSSGLGRVDGDMAAIIHDNEAILPAHQAETLRELGVIQGDGRYPTLDTSPLVSTTTVSTNNGGGMHVAFGDINVTVQGGQSDRNLANKISTAVRDGIEEHFAELSLMMPVTREW